MKRESATTWSAALLLAVGLLAWWARVKEPATTVALFESNLHTPNASGTVAAVAKPPRHGDGNNYAFVDGHIKLHTTPPSFGPDVSQKPKGKATKAKPRKSKAR